jgi:predicted membrane metal-binding protein
MYLAKNRIAIFQLFPSAILQESFQISIIILSALVISSSGLVL